MADKKGILTKDQEKALATFLDEKIKFKNSLLETFDGIVFGGIITIVDDYAVDQLSVVYKDPLLTLVEGIEKDDMMLIAEAAANILDTVIDIPNVTDTVEAQLFETTVKYLATIIFTFIEKELQEEEI